MKEIALTALYWFANLLLLVWAAAMAVELWQKPHRVRKAVGLLVGGMAWHVVRGLYEYRIGSCSSPDEKGGFLALANRCIPGTDIDVIYAQVAIFVGLFVLLAERFREQGNGSQHGAPSDAKNAIAFLAPLSLALGH